MAKLFLAVPLAALFIGCPARSIFQLFTEKDVVFNPSLFGSWVGESGEETYSFLPPWQKSYAVIVREKDGSAGTYTVELGRIGKFWFLDSYPQRNAHEYHMIRTHVISKIQIDEDTLRLSTLEGDWLKKMTETTKLDIPHVTLKDDFILTASTEELQQLVLRFAEDTDAFTHPMKLSRYMGGER